MLSDKELEDLSHTVPDSKQQKKKRAEFVKRTYKNGLKNHLKQITNEMETEGVPISVFLNDDFISTTEIAPAAFAFDLMKILRKRGYRVTSCVDLHVDETQRRADDTGMEELRDELCDKLGKECDEPIPTVDLEIELPENDENDAADKPENSEHVQKKEEVEEEEAEPEKEEGKLVKKKRNHKRKKQT